MTKRRRQRPKGNEEADQVAAEAQDKVNPDPQGKPPGQTFEGVEPGTGRARESFSRAISAAEMAWLPAVKERSGWLLGFMISSPNAAPGTSRSQKMAMAVDLALDLEAEWNSREAEAGGQ